MRTKLRQLNFFEKLFDEDQERQRRKKAEERRRLRQERYEQLENMRAGAGRLDDSHQIGAFLAGAQLKLNAAGELQELGQLSPEDLKSLGLAWHTDSSNLFNLNIIKKYGDLKVKDWKELIKKGLMNEGGIKRKRKEGLQGPSKNRKKKRLVREGSDDCLESRGRQSRMHGDSKHGVVSEDDMEEYKFDMDGKEDGMSGRSDLDDSQGSFYRLGGEHSIDSYESSFGDEGVSRLAIQRGRGFNHFQKATHQKIKENKERRRRKKLMMTEVSVGGSSRTKNKKKKNKDRSSSRQKIKDLKKKDKQDLFNSDDSSDSNNLNQKNKKKGLTMKEVLAKGRRWDILGEKYRFIDDLKNLEKYDLDDLDNSDEDEDSERKKERKRVKALLKRMKKERKKRRQNGLIDSDDSLLSDMSLSSLSSDLIFSDMFKKSEIESQFSDDHEIFIEQIDNNELKRDEKAKQEEEKKVAKRASVREYFKGYMKQQEKSAQNQKTASDLLSSVNLSEDMKEGKIIEYLREKDLLDKGSTSTLSNTTKLTNPSNISNSGNLKGSEKKSFSFSNLLTVTSQGHLKYEEPSENSQSSWKSNKFDPSKNFMDMIGLLTNSNQLKTISETENDFDNIDLRGAKNIEEPSDGDLYHRKRLQAIQELLNQKNVSLEEGANNDMTMLKHAKKKILEMIRNKTDKREIKKYLRIRFKVFERLYLQYCFYLNEELSAGDSGQKRPKKELYELKTVLLNELADYESIKKCDEELGIGKPSHPYKPTSIHPSEPSIPEVDFEKLRFILENGQKVIRPIKLKTSKDKINLQQLRKTLDLIILSVLFEAQTGKKMDPHNQKKNKILNPLEVEERKLDSSPESLLEFFKLNQSLISFLRENLLTRLSPIFNVRSATSEKSSLQSKIKQEISHLIESVCIKNPFGHARLIAQGNRLEDREDNYYRPQRLSPRNRPFLVKLDPFLAKKPPPVSNQAFDDTSIFKEMYFMKKVEKREKARNKVREALQTASQVSEDVLSNGLGTRRSGKVGKHKSSSKKKKAAAKEAFASLLDSHSNVDLKYKNKTKETS